MTNLEIVSRITNTINALTKDVRKSRRYILNVARSKASFLISQKLGERSLIKEDNIYTTINCFEMEKIDVVKCDIIEFRRCKAVMRSKKKLPKLINSRIGNSLKEVTSLDDEREFKATTPSQYRRDKNRGKSDYVEYYVKNGYLYIVDAEIFAVNLYLITLETDKVDSASSCSDKDCDCKSLWEYDFTVPDKLLDTVVTESVKEIILSIQNPTDENPNLNSNEK
jgi:hypothetical protein